MLHNFQSSRLALTTDFTPDIIINLSAFGSVFALIGPIPGSLRDCAMAQLLK
jgi:hypothetical protein